MVYANLNFLALVALSFLARQYVRAVALYQNEPQGAALAACSQIRNLNGSFATSYPEQPQWIDDVSHWSNASSLAATCTVEPNSIQEVQELILLINSTRAPWAVKSVGHCNNNNMSATHGVQISLSKFKDIEINSTEQTVKLGVGLTWGAVYSALDPYGIAVLGGRVASVGVGGLLLSGGYSWKTNEFGLASDNIVAWDLITPTGKYISVTEESSPDLFFALQGGVNNFGIVTSITVKSHPQGDVWGGIVSLTGDLSKAIEATAKYANTTSDPKATLGSLFGASAGQTSITVIIFYDAPEPPNGLFDDFLALPNATVSVGKQSYSEFVSSVVITTSPTNRATWHSAPVLHWPQELIQYITEQMVIFGNISATEGSGTSISANVEPFLPSAYSFNRGTAIPHSPATPYNTFNGLVIWTDPAQDEFSFKLAQQYHETIWKKAIELGVSYENATFYPNYAISGTTVESIYGENLPRLQQIKKAIDPYDIIGLTGGFSI